MPLIVVPFTTDPLYTRAPRFESMTVLNVMETVVLPPPRMLPKPPKPPDWVCVACADRIPAEKPRRKVEIPSICLIFIHELMREPRKFMLIHFLSKGKLLFRFEGE